MNLVVLKREWYHSRRGKIFLVLPTVPNKKWDTKWILFVYYNMTDWNYDNMFVLPIFLEEFKAMSKSSHAQKYEGWWGLKYLYILLLSALSLDTLWISSNKSFRSRFLWLISFLPGNEWWVFHSEAKANNRGFSYTCKCIFEIY